jgi:outer membrane protein assembly factor BamA
MGPHLLAMLFLAIPPQLLSPSFESGIRFQLNKGTATQPVNGIIREVRFAGLNRIFSEGLQGHINSRAGDPADQRMVEHDVRALANLSWFDSVRAEVVPVTDSVAGDEPSDLRLVFELTERPYLIKDSVAYLTRHTPEAPTVRPVRKDSET